MISRWKCKSCANFNSVHSLFSRVLVFCSSCNEFRWPDLPILAASAGALAAILVVYSLIFSPGDNKGTLLQRGIELLVTDKRIADGLITDDVLSDIKNKLFMGTPTESNDKEALWSEVKIKYIEKKREQLSMHQLCEMAKNMHINLPNLDCKIQGTRHKITGLELWHIGYGTYGYSLKDVQDILANNPDGWEVPAVDDFRNINKKLNSFQNVSTELSYHKPYWTRENGPGGKKVGYCFGDTDKCANEPGVSEYSSYDTMAILFIRRELKSK